MFSDNRSGLRYALDGKATTMKRIRGYTWQKIRSRIIFRDCGLCQECKRNGKITIGAEVDHIQQLADGGSNEDENLELLCRDCHADKTAKDNGKQRKPMIGIDGWPIG